MREGERCTSVAEGDFQIEEFVYVCVCKRDKEREGKSERHASVTEGGVSRLFD